MDWHAELIGGPQDGREQMLEWPVSLIAIPVMPGSMSELVAAAVGASPLTIDYYLLAEVDQACQRLRYRWDHQSPS